MLDNVYQGVVYSATPVTRLEDDKRVSGPGFLLHNQHGELVAAILGGPGNDVDVLEASQHMLLTLGTVRALLLASACMQEQARAKTVQDAVEILEDTLRLCHHHQVSGVTPVTPGE
jgi:hypothetical protein